MINFQTLFEMSRMKLGMKVVPGPDVFKGEAEEVGFRIL